MNKMSRVTTLVILCLMVLLITGCTTNPVTGRKQLILVSENTAINASEEAYVDMLKPLSKDGKVNSDPVLVKRVQEITARLIPHAIKYRPNTAKWDWQVTVIDDPEVVNAFCMAGGKMAIYTGLIEKINPTDDEIAQVMGHEIAHALSSHTAEKMSVAMASSLGVLAVGIARKNDTATLAGASLAAKLAIELPNSRMAESESDRIGIELAAKAGYNPKAAITLWEKMEKAGGKKMPQFLSTHPSPKSRIDALKALVPKMEHWYKSNDTRPVYQWKVI